MAGALAAILDHEVTLGTETKHGGTDREELVGARGWGGGEG